MNTSENGAPVIFVDADSCPVKKEIADLASAFSIEFLFVASYAHTTSDPTYTEWKYVDPDREAADMYIMNHVAKGDVTVTQDIGLASTLLPKGVYVLSPKGILFEEKGIQTALDLRYLHAKARARGKYSKGPAPFSPEDRRRFVKELTRILSKITK